MRLTMTGLCGASCLAVAASCCLWRHDGPRLADVAVVAEDGYFDDASKRWGLAAARDLTNALSRVTGRSIPLCRESSAPTGVAVPLYLGNTRSAHAAGLDSCLTKRGEFRVKVMRDRVFLVGLSGMAGSYAVTDFLSKQANYDFMTIDGNDPFEKRPNKKMSICDYSRVHPVYARHFSLWGSRYPRTSKQYLHDYGRRTGLAVSGEIEGGERPSASSGSVCHSFFRFVPPEKYAKTHPEYYGMDASGARPSLPYGELCLTNPDVKRIVHESLLAFIAKDREGRTSGWPLIYDFSQEDNCDYMCLCPDCRKVIARYNRVPGGHKEGGDAGLLLEFVNELARKVAERYPDIILRTFAYVSTEDLPDGIVPERNVMPWVCDLYTRSDHTRPLTHPFNRSRLDMIRKWAAVSRQIELWDYYLYSADFPEVQADAISADTRLFRELGVRRVYVENHFARQPFFELNTFVMGRCYQEPDADVDGLVRRGCRMFGAGAPEMEKAVALLRKAIAEGPAANATAWHTRTLPWRTIANMERLLALADCALEKPLAAAERARVARVAESSVRELLRLMKNRPELEARRSVLKARYRALAEQSLDGCPLDEEERRRDRNDIARYLDTFDIRFRDLPDALKGVPERDLVMQNVATTYIAPHEGERVSDPLSEASCAIRWLPWKGAKPPSNACFDDREGKRITPFEFKPVMQPGYRWYRLGVARVTRICEVYVPIRLAWYASDNYIECDGMDEDPNWYEFWMSVRWDADPFTADKSKGFFLDRLILHRVKSPDGR